MVVVEAAAAAAVEAGGGRELGDELHAGGMTN